MLQQIWTYLTDANAGIVAQLSQYPLLQSLYSGARGLLIIFVVVFIIEWASGGNIRRYWSRNFRTDMLYGLLYNGGIYNTIIYRPLIAVLALLVPAWQFRLIDHLPALAGFLAYWLITDFAGYWIHRLYHSNDFLWTFHRVHHSQTELTFVTSFRNHIVEQIISNIIMFVPAILLGVPVWFWGPVFLMQNLFEGLQHSDIKWRYGFLYPVLVSPVFHAIHHSPERARHDSNYGKILSVWDYLFGTISIGERPANFGLVGDSTPVSFSGTLMEPFRILWKRAFPDQQKSVVATSSTPSGLNRGPSAT
ncbi:sterol desaturase family protein [Bradyrhizobium sp.]|uniref:sterol desaturase family protein n=1 Tax=Bradyrhizobium sp. TaxID=376 RepID=UPI003C76EE98